MVQAADAVRKTASGFGRMRRSVSTSYGPALLLTRGVGPSCGRRAHRTRCMPSILTASDTLMSRVRSGRRRVDHDVAKSRALGSVRAARPASPQGSHSSTTAARLNRLSSGAPSGVGHPTMIGGSRPVGAHGWGVGYRAPSVARDRLGDRSRPRGRRIEGGPEPTRGAGARGATLRRGTCGERDVWLASEPVWP